MPDKEIVNLCSLYGKLTNGKVHREKVRLGGKERHTVISSTRYMEAQLYPGKPMKNYYWIISPGQGEVGKRVLCLHPNQPKQCSWCFKYPPSTPSTPASRATAGTEGTVRPVSRPRPLGPRCQSI